MLGGRGAGKTRAGAEWVRRVALDGRRARIALVGETEHGVRSVMVEGVSGLLSIHRSDEQAKWFPTRRRLEWKNRAIAEILSAENYEGLRGPQFSAAWCDELAKWRHAEATFDMLQFGLRLGARPRQVITTTPRPIALLKKLITGPTTVATRGNYHRAEPVSQLYEQGRVRHAGTFPALEDEMCDFGVDGLSSGRSPDRLDALVRAVAALTLPQGPSRGSGCCRASAEVVFKPSRAHADQLWSGEFALFELFATEADSSAELLKVR
ncbi:MAG: DNA-packaging protein [Pseudolabrys sp.]|nr:DNA-packaging protein [Pseudolabrys sp.]